MTSERYLFEEQGENGMLACMLSREELLVWLIEYVDSDSAQEWLNTNPSVGNECNLLVGRITRLEDELTLVEKQVLALCYNCPDTLIEIEEIIYVGEEDDPIFQDDYDDLVKFLTKKVVVKLGLPDCVDPYLKSFRKVFLTAGDL